MINFSLGANPKLADALKAKTTFDVNKIANADNFVEFLNSFIEMQKISFDDKNKYNEIIIPGLLKISNTTDPKYNTENSFDKAKIFDAQGKLSPAAVTAFEAATTGLPSHVKIDANTDLSKLKADFDALYTMEIKNTLLEKKVAITKAEDISRYLQVLNFLNTIVKDQIFDATQYVGAAGSQVVGKFDMANFLETDKTASPTVTGLSDLGLKLINDTLTKLKIKDASGSADLKLLVGDKANFTNINSAMTSIFAEAIKLDVKDGFIVDKSNPVVKNDTDPNKIKGNESNQQTEQPVVPKTIEMTITQYILGKGYGAKEKEVEGKKIKVQTIDENGKQVEYQVDMNKQGVVTAVEVLGVGGVPFLIYKLVTKDKIPSEKIQENNENIVE